MGGGGGGWWVVVLVVVVRAVLMLAPSEESQLESEGLVIANAARGKISPMSGSVRGLAVLSLPTPYSSRALPPPADRYEMDSDPRLTMHPITVLDRPLKVLLVEPARQICERISNKKPKSSPGPPLLVTSLEGRPCSRIAARARTWPHAASQLDCIAQPLPCIAPLWISVRLRGSTSQALAQQRKQTGGRSESARASVCLHILQQDSLRRR